MDGLLGAIYWVNPNLPTLPTSAPRGDRVPAFGLFADGADIVVRIPSSLAFALDGNLNVDVLRVLNANSLAESPRRKYEMRGSLSSLNEDGTSNNDAWVEVRINDRVYQDGEDFDTVDPTSPPNICTQGTRGLNTYNQLGWSVGRVHSLSSCCYLNESATYCQSGDLGSGGGSGDGGSDSPICDPPGPGAGSFDGSSDGPRRVAPGGVTPVYIEPVGEGVPALAEDEVDPQPLTTMTAPLVSLDLTLCDATVHRFAKARINRQGAPPSLPGVISWGDVTYPLSDRFGNLQAQTWDVTLADPDGTIRGWLGSGSNRFYKRWEGKLFIEDDAARLAGTARRSLARGRCSTVRVTEDFTVTLTFSDELSRHDSPFSLDRELPHVLMGDVFGPGWHADGVVPLTAIADQMAARALPLLGAEPSDEYLAAEGGIPIGINKLHYICDVRLVDGNTWHAYAVCLYAVYGIPALFGSNQNPDCPASVRLDMSNFLVPGWGSAPFAWSLYFGQAYIPIVRHGVTYWVTMIFGRGPVSQAHVDGKVPLSCNVNGYETVGDATGELIDDAGYFLHWLLDVPFLRRLTAGPWGDVARFPDGVSKIKSSDFTAIVARHAQRISYGVDVGETEGFNHMRSGDFATGWGFNWFPDVGWDQVAEAAQHTPGSAGRLVNNTFEIVEGTTYRLRFTLSGCTAGVLTVNPDSSTPLVLGPGDNGAIVADVVMDGPDFHVVIFAADADFDGTLDDTSLRAIIPPVPKRRGYRIGLILDTQKSARDVLAQVLVSMDVRLGLNHLGQITATTPELVPDLASLVTFRDDLHIEEKSFKITSEISGELENSLDYEGGPEPASGRLTVPKANRTVTTSVTNWGDVYKAQPQTFICAYRAKVCNDLAARRLSETQDGITRGEFMVDLAGSELAGGQLIRLTHHAGLGPLGWTNRILRATTRVLHANKSIRNEDGSWSVDPVAFSTQVTWEDQHTKLEKPPGAVGPGTSRIGFRPMGRNTDGTGWRMGSIADGTAWRMG